MDVQKTIKWGVAYNVWEDAIELLPYSVQSIRDSVDFITVIYQTTSNLGQRGCLNTLPTLLKLKQEGWIDEYYLFSPNIRLGGHQNEINKRNVGLVRCRNNGCDYMASMDADELYLKEEYDYMKKALVEGGYMASACQMLTYYKNAEYILDPPEDYYVSLFFKIDKASKFVLGGHAPVLIDPTRRIPSAGWKIFNRNEIQMHHFSYVRNDIRKKLMNSSAVVNYQHLVDHIIEDFNRFPESSDMANIAGRLFTTKKIDPYFKIDL